MPPERHPKILPLVKVIPGRYRAADPLFGPHRPVLLERSSALNGRLLVARALKDLVGPIVGGKVALGRPGLVGRELAVRLDDVVLDERVLRPAVDGEVAGARRLVSAAVSDLPSNPVSLGILSPMEL